MCGEARLMHSRAVACAASFPSRPLEVEKEGRRVSEILSVLWKSFLSDTSCVQRLGVSEDHYGILARLVGQCYGDLLSCIRAFGPDSHCRWCRPLVVCDPNHEGATSRVLHSVHVSCLGVIAVVVPDIVYPGKSPSSMMFGMHVARDALNFQAFADLRGYLVLLFVVGF